MKQILFITLIIIGACSPEPPTAQSIVDEAINRAGGKAFEDARISFTFRDKDYTYQNQHGRYEYTRIFEDSTGQVKDVLTNDGFKRHIGTHLVDVADTMKVKYSNSVNSVIYFALLPYGLNAPAANKSLLASEEINGKSYYKVLVTFDEKGGGADFEDQFIYWINKENYYIDYLAYSYHTDGGGMRFRVANNERFVEGLRFVDYDNYKPPTELHLMDIGKAFEANQLMKISEINLEHVVVQLGNK